MGVQILRKDWAQLSACAEATRISELREAVGRGFGELLPLEREGHIWVCVFLRVPFFWVGLQGNEKDANGFFGGSPRQAFSFFLIMGRLCSIMMSIGKARCFRFDCGVTTKWDTAGLIAVKCSDRLLIGIERDSTRSVCLIVSRVPAPHLLAVWGKGKPQGSAPMGSPHQFFSGFGCVSCSRRVFCFFKLEWKENGKGLRGPACERGRFWKKGAAGLATWCGRWQQSG